MEHEFEESDEIEITNYSGVSAFIWGYIVGMWVYFIYCYLLPV